MRIRTIEIDEGVAEVLRNSRIEGNALFLPPGQLERKLYERVDKVLKALGGKWDRRAAGHVFAKNGAGDIAAALAGELNAAIDAGGVVDLKKTLELFETPGELAERMARMAWGASLAGRPIRFLEPSAGRGRLIEAWQLYAPTGAGNEILAIDIDRANCDALEDQGIADDVIHHDFLELGCQLGQMCDVILMNPPFAANADIEHVLHAYHGWLAPGGILVAIMSAHFTFAADRASREFRALLRYGPDDPNFATPTDVVQCEVETLPEGTFKGEGTMVNAVLVTIRKAG